MGELLQLMEFRERFIHNASQERDSADNTLSLLTEQRPGNSK